MQHALFRYLVLPPGRCWRARSEAVWAALRKGPDSQNKKVENERLEKAAEADGKFLSKKQLKQVDGTMQII